MRHAEGGYQIVDNQGNFVGHLPTPWAMGAKGEEVLARYVYDEDAGSPTLEVKHQAVGYEDPVVANPCLRF